MGIEGLEQGEVLFIPVRLAAHRKFLIFLGTHKGTNQAGFFTINSQGRTNPTKQRFQYLIPAKRNKSFLFRDSYVDCAEVQKFRATEINSLIEKDRGVKRGNVASTDLGSIIALADSCPAISPIDKLRFGIRKAAG